MQRIKDDLANWVQVTQFPVNGDGLGSKLSECCARVARWASARASNSDTPVVEIDQFRTLAALASELAELLTQTNTISRSQLERLLRSICRWGWPAGEIAQLGHAHWVSNPAAIREAADTILWWNFCEPATPPRTPWTELELEQLAAHGTTFPSKETLAAYDNLA